MFETVLSYLRFPFMQRALIVGALVSLCAALLGVSLVLKRYSMIGDGLSHVGFCALTIAAAANLAPLEVAVPVVMAAAFLLLRINANSSESMATRPSRCSRPRRWRSARSSFP